MKVLAFDIWADYAHFRKFYTTTSPLTFSFPPPPTIAGILGAIYGTEKNSNEYLRIFLSQDCKISLRIINPVRKIRMGINLLETKGTNLKRPMSSGGPHRTQIRTEFIRNPRFRIYVAHQNDKIFHSLAAKIRDHETVYSVSLGLSELLANFEYVGTYEAEPVSDCFDYIHSPIKSDLFVRLSDNKTQMGANLEQNPQPDGLEIEDDKRYFKERIPLDMDPDRVVKSYVDVIFEPDGKPIRARLKEFYKLKTGENVAFF
jgi:CRISPR-associated protein Cas5h